VLGEAWFRLGDFALERQDLSTARRHFIVASRLAPESSPAHGKLALVYQLDGDWPAADRELRAVVDKEPENLEFVLRLGLLHAEHAFKARSAKERTDATTEATKWLDKVLEAQPENALASRALEKLNSQTRP
jgi:tetratricopeptide (TPR) repeat protein